MWKPCAMRKCSATGLALPAGTLICSGKRSSTVALLAMERLDESARGDCAKDARATKPGMIAAIVRALKVINSLLPALCECCPRYHPSRSGPVELPPLFRCDPQKMMWEAHRARRRVC